MRQIFHKLKIKYASKNNLKSTLSLFFFLHLSVNQILNLGWQLTTSGSEPWFTSINNRGKEHTLFYASTSKPNSAVDIHRLLCSYL
jgi:hypothetical protein